MIEKSFELFLACSTLSAFSHCFHFTKRRKRDRCCLPLFILSLSFRRQMPGKLAPLSENGGREGGRQISAPFQTLCVKLFSQVIRSLWLKYNSLQIQVNRDFTFSVQGRVKSNKKRCRRPPDMSLVCFPSIARLISYFSLSLSLFRSLHQIPGPDNVFI